MKLLIVPTLQDDNEDSMRGYTEGTQLTCLRHAVFCRAWYLAHAQNSNSKNYRVGRPHPVAKAGSTVAFYGIQRTVTSWTQARLKVGVGVQSSSRRKPSSLSYTPASTWAGDGAGLGGQTQHLRGKVGYSGTHTGCRDHGQASTAKAAQP